jgi:hypothetical protein
MRIRERKEENEREKTIEEKEREMVLWEKKK